MGLSAAPYRNEPNVVNSHWAVSSGVSLGVFQIGHSQDLDNLAAGNSVGLGIGAKLSLAVMYTF